MASIFTFDPDIPRVSSPWAKHFGAQDVESDNDWHVGNGNEPIDLPGTITKLEAEPQEGPVEYKLHLLLRPRRNFSRIRTASNIAPGPHVKHVSPSLNCGFEHIANPVVASLGPLTMQSRQHRLEQLTTQLLWRLQQSSPHHTSSASNMILPFLPEALPELQTPPQIGKLLHGLEESQGALYELGVSDDGSFIGLAEDELKESLNNLRAMAACMGCVVEVLRLVRVGDAEWLEQSLVSGPSAPPARKTSKLLVAEAMVKPHFSAALGETSSTLNDHTRLRASDETPLSGRQDPMAAQMSTQMRVSLTGATGSGKSSLLGTLSTSTLDNARGKSRLTMLKHRHEITSGLTSSVSQELVGYSEASSGDVDVINYATASITSWIDIHAACDRGRLVFFSDSAGHPRYRRTTVRGLVGWVPHWAFLCVPANDAQDPLIKCSDMLDPTMTSSTEVDLSAAHLDLCLRLGLPLVIVITKLDTASKSGLRVVLAKLLSVLKNAGRRPAIVPNAPATTVEEQLRTNPLQRINEVQRLITDPSFDPRFTVPIVMTSALQGTGIDNLHALMHGLPILSSEASHPVASRSSAPAFQIEDVYHKATDPQLTIVAGHLQRGHIRVGDELFIGPCSTESDESDDSDGPRQRRPSTAPQSRSFPGALRPAHFLAHKDHIGQEWRRVQVASIRNLRLPVSTLYADQVGTIGLCSLDDDDDTQHIAPPAPRVRKGMVLLRQQDEATSDIVAEFRREDLGSLAVGCHVVVYIASVRASARIVSASIPPAEHNGRSTQQSVGRLADGIASLGALELGGDDVDGRPADEPVAGAVTHEMLHVTFHFMTTREYIERGSTVLVMPGGGPGLFGGSERGEKGVAGLEGFVGRIVDMLA